MTISLKCSCGRLCRFREVLAGRKTRCPQCGKVVKVPLADDNGDDDEEPVELLEVASSDDEHGIRTDKRDDAPRRPRSREEEPSESPRPRGPRRKSLRKREKRQPLVAFEEGWFGSLNGGVVGGVLMMLIAAVWFVVGLWAGWLFYYPPILFVIGIIAIIKGCMGGE
jgi:hypothetical protein